MNNDLISRSALKEQINATDFDFGDYYDNTEEIRKRVCEAIDNAPPVEPFEPDYVGAERLAARQRGYEDGYHYGMKIGRTLNPQIKQGAWIVIHTATGKTKCKCNQCHHYIKIDDDKNFCPNCGAKMQTTENNY